MRKCDRTAAKRENFGKKIVFWQMEPEGCRNESQIYLNKSQQLLNVSELSVGESDLRLSVPELCQNEPKLYQNINLRFYVERRGDGRL
jgi:hypothetical protein